MTDSPTEVLKEALENLRKDRKEIYSRISSLTAESKTYNLPQKELSIAKSVAKLFEILQKINSEIIKISAMITKSTGSSEEDVVFSSSEEDVYSSIGDDIIVKREEL
jgi:hypothetical protein